MFKAIIRNSKGIETNCGAGRDGWGFPTREEADLWVKNQASHFPPNFTAEIKDVTKEFIENEIAKKIELALILKEQDDKKEKIANIKSSITLDLTKASVEEIKAVLKEIEKK